MKIIDKFFSWFSRTKLWLWFARNIVGHLNFRLFGYPNFPMSKYQKIIDAIKRSEESGYFLYAFVSCDSKSLAAYLIRWVSQGYYSHAGIINYPVPDQIVHMRGDGVQQDLLLDLLKEIDNFAIVRYPISKENLDKANLRIKDVIDSQIPYDYQQEIDSNKLYCSELVWTVGDDLVELSGFDPNTELGRQVFDPDRVYQLGQVIFEHRSS